MRIHPIFTQVKDWTGDGQPDGIEALLEFQDQFNDPTKAAGTVIFELYRYDPHRPDSRGERVVNPWVGSLKTLADQQARWNRTSRTYFFQLEYPAVRRDQSYVLVASFDTGATRFFDEVILEGQHGGVHERHLPPATSPAHVPGPATTEPTVGPAEGASARVSPASTATTSPAGGVDVRPQP
jgi:hypothetical protein